MKKIIALSDSHGNPSVIEKLYPLMEEADTVVTLGDMAGDYQAIKKKFGDKLIAVNGNCDPYYINEELVEDFCGVKTLIAHGHRYKVKSGLEDIAIRALELNAKAVLYGHTHEAGITELYGVKLINPGSLSAAGNKTYCYMTALDGKIHAVIVDLKA